MLKVALLQMVSCGADQEANLRKGTDFCRRAWAAQAVPEDGAFVGHFRDLARELDMAIALTYLQRGDPAPRNAVSLIDRHGEIRLTYAKVHTCDFAPESACAPGDSFHVCTLDTA